MLMVGHVRLTAADPDRAASHSKKVVDGIIRRKWNYQGVIITDDFYFRNLKSGINSKRIGLHLAFPPL